VKKACHRTNYTVQYDPIFLKRYKKTPRWTHTNELKEDWKETQTVKQDEAGGVGKRDLFLFYVFLYVSFSTF
jgi:hypothetical protein